MAIKKTKKSNKVPATSKMITDLSKKALTIIGKLDAIDAGTEAKQTLLGELINEIGGSSFAHPENGPMSVMTRGDVFFWRAKPNGRAKGTTVAKKTAKPAKKVAKKVTKKAA